MKKISIIIPCYNEEKGLGKVIDNVPKTQLRRLGYRTEIIVIDNNSSDRTINVAKDRGVRIVSEEKQGKGHALITGFKSVSSDTDYIVMIDGDNTYKSKEIPRMIEPLENDFCDVIIGSRLEGKLDGFSLSLSHRLANWFFTFFVRRFYLTNTTDTCTGFFAWKKEVVDELVPQIRSSGFAIEAEMITKMAKLGYKIYSVPITYDAREGYSKLSPIIDGIKITWMLCRNLAWKPSLKELSSMENDKNKKMKIAFVSDAIWPYNKGGKEKRLFDFSTRLAEREYEVHIYTMKWWKGSNIKEEEGITLHAICKLYPLYSGNRRSVREGIMFGLACLRLIREDWDVIDVDHMPFFPLFSVKIVCLLKRKKMIATWHEVWGKKYWIEYMGILGNIAYVIERLSVLTPDKIISISKHTTNKLRKDLSFKKEIVTIPIGINLTEIDQIKPSKIKSDIIFAGRLLKHKNVDVLINAIEIINRKIPNVICMIIGEGPEKENLVDQVNKLNLKKNIKFLDFLPRNKDLYALMKSSKMFVLPSTREGFGIVVLEAGACGIPVITVNHSDNAARNLINEKNGFIVKFDVQEISEMIMKILKNNINEKMYQTCHDSAKKYDSNKISIKKEEVYLK